MKNIQPLRTARLRRILIVALMLAVIVSGVGYLAPPFYTGYRTLWDTTHGDCIEYGGTPASYGLPYRDVIIPTRWGGSYRGFFIPGTLDATILIPPTGAGGRTANLRDITMLARHGYSVLNWESRVCVGKPQSLGYREAEDVEDAYSWLQHNPASLPVSLDHVGLYGFSTAGATVEFTAERDSQFAAIVAIGNYATPVDMAASVTDHPASVPQAMLGLGVRVGYRAGTGDDLNNLNPLGAFGNIAPRPVLLIYGSLERGAGADRLVSAYQAANASGTIRLWIVPGAWHGAYIDLVGMPAYSAHVLPFFDCALLQRCGSAGEDYF